MNATAAAIAARFSTVQLVALLVTMTLLAVVTGLAIEHLVGAAAQQHAQPLAWGRNGG